MISEVVAIKGDVVFLKDTLSGEQFEIVGEHFCHLKEGELLAYNYITIDKSNKPALALFSFNYIKGVCLPEDLLGRENEFKNHFEIYLDALAMELVLALSPEQLVKYECEFILGVSPTRVFKDNKAQQLLLYFIDETEDCAAINQVGINVNKYDRLEHFIEDKLKKSKTVSINSKSELVLDDIRLPMRSINLAFITLCVSKKKHLRFNSYFSLHKSWFGYKIRFNSVSRKLTLHKKK